MPGRTIAVGDIHGYAAALNAILTAVEPGADDTIVTLGDYVDRGPDSPGVIRALIDLSCRCRLVPLLGNHDEMLLETRGGAAGLAAWLGFGGRETLAAYGCEHPDQIPEDHAAFLRACVGYHEIETHFFVHAGYLPDLPLAGQPAEILRWTPLRRQQLGPHCSGKIAICGHTAQHNGEILDLGFVKCIDTCCYCGNWLTALDVTSGRVWQAMPDGTMRKTPATP
jgi:serine/threonine protein phosphatase 1